LNFAPLIEKVFGTLDVSRKEAEDFLDKVCATKIEDAIEKGYEELARMMGAYRNAMSMKREKITNVTVLIAKKRYIMNVLNSEGVHFEEPKISVTGIESVRSSTPEVCREKMKEAFRVIMNGTEKAVQEFIEEFRQEFYKLPAEAIAKISGTDDIDKYRNGTTYKKGCPIHVRGCIVYNQMLKDRKLDRKYSLIESGEKIKFVYLRVPNPVRENMISFPNVLPKELVLDQYIDYETQFDKVFLSPIVNILDAIGWKHEQADTLEDFFV
jgi:DNA polymerase elongation subunit (family B)